MSPISNQPERLPMGKSLKEIRAEIESEEIRNYVRSLCRKWLQGSNDHAVNVDVITNTVLFKAWKNAGQFKGQSALKTWLTRIAKNEVLDYFRKAQREKPNISIDEDSDFQFQLSDSRLDPLESLLQKEESATLAAGMETLSPLQKRVIEAYLYKTPDENYEDLAKKLGLKSIGYFKNTLFRAKGKLIKANAKKQKWQKLKKS